MREQKFTIHIGITISNKGVLEQFSSLHISIQLRNDSFNDVQESRQTNKNAYSYVNIWEPPDYSKRIFGRV